MRSPHRQRRGPNHMETSVRDLLVVRAGESGCQTSAIRPIACRASARGRLSSPRGCACACCVGAMRVHPIADDRWHHHVLHRMMSNAWRMCIVNSSARRCLSHLNAQECVSIRRCCLPAFGRTHPPTKSSYMCVCQCRQHHLSSTVRGYDAALWLVEGSGIKAGQ